MAKQTQTDNPKPTFRERLDRFKASCAMVGRCALRVGYVCLWLGLAGGTIYGLNWCREHVRAMPEYRQGTTIKLTDLPAWLRRPENRHVVDQILRAARLDPGEGLMVDDALAYRVATKLRGCPWVRQVVKISKDDREPVLAVQCEYRYPGAWVRQDDRCYLVDAEGCRLPGIYNPSEAEPAGLITIVGATAGAPEVGQQWPGPDVQAGLKLVEMLQTSLRGQIAAVDVTNYQGRADPLAPDIKLQARRLGSEIFWGHAPDEEYQMELTACKKIKLLEDNLRRYGRVDGNRPYLDIRTTPPYQPLPREEPTSKAGAVARQPGDEGTRA